MDDKMHWPTLVIDIHYATIDVNGVDSDNFISSFILIMKLVYQKKETNKLHDGMEMHI